MSSQNSTSDVNKWVYVVIALVAIIGLLAGLLISKSTAPALMNTASQVHTEQPTQIGNPPPPGNPNLAERDVRRMVRNLSPERRRAVLSGAMKNLEAKGYERPRTLMLKRQQARQQMLEIARADTFDPEAMRTALDNMHTVNSEAAKHGTELTIEVLKLMTPEERIQATERRQRSRRDRFQRNIDKRRGRD